MYLSRFNYIINIIVMYFKKYYTNYHLIFFSILSLNYLISLFLFGEVTLFYRDNLDSEIIYNYIIGKAYKNGLNEFQIFLSGELNYTYFRRFFFPITYLYSLFTLEIAWLITDIFLKSCTYLIFFKISYEVNQNKLFSCLIAAFFASITDQIHLGFSFLSLVYFFYTFIIKNEINIYNYLIIFLIGLNTDLHNVLICIPFLFILIVIQEKKIFLNSQRVIFIFIYFLSILIANLNLFINVIFEVENHRTEIIKSGTNLNLLNFIELFLIKLFRFPQHFDFRLLLDIPFLAILIPIILVIIIKKLVFLKKFILFLLFISFLLVIFESSFYVNFINNVKFGNIYNLTYLSYVLPVLYFIILIYLSSNHKIFKKFIFPPLLISLIFLQIDSNVVPFYKEKILKLPNYKNIYTFSGYYDYESYKKVKEIVKNKRVLSVGLDPMIPVISDIYVVNGYHNLYPLNFKKKFKKIIEEELINNSEFVRNFETYGSELKIDISKYSEPLYLNLNFEEAKNLKTEFILSSKLLNNSQLILINKISENIYLYKIV